MRIFFMPRRVRQATAALVFAGLASFVAFAQLGGSSGVIIPYSGHLELDGEPVTSLTPVNLRFTLWSAASGGSACATKYTASTAVHGGRFSVEIGPVAESCVLGKQVHLAVEVEGAAGYTALAGRQRVYPALGAMTSGTGDFVVAETLDVVGDAAIDGDALIAGDAHAARLRISASEDAQLDNGAGSIIIGATTDANLALDNNEIMARSNGGASPLYLNLLGGNVHLGAASSDIVMDGSVRVGGNAKGFVRGGGTRICTGNSATLLECSDWGTGDCAATSGSCGAASGCSKGTATWVTGVTACYAAFYGNFSAACQSWLCVE